MSAILGQEWLDCYLHDILKRTNPPRGLMVFPVSVDVDARACSEAMKALEAELEREP